MRNCVAALTPTWPARLSCDHPTSRRAALTCAGVSVISRSHGGRGFRCGQFYPVGTLAQAHAGAPPSFPGYSRPGFRPNGAGVGRVPSVSLSSLRIASERVGRGSGCAAIQASICCLSSSVRRDSSIGSIFVSGLLGIGFFISRLPLANSRPPSAVPSAMGSAPSLVFVGIPGVRGQLGGRLAKRLCEQARRMASGREGRGSGCAAIQASIFILTSSRA
jgi:hypothetical protein